MTRSDILPAWGQVLRGRRPRLSIEITKECPFRCHGCYAYESNRVSFGVGLRQLADYPGQELVDRVLELPRQHLPPHISIVGGEPWFDIGSWTSYFRRWTTWELKAS
jgi:MoaA/NifB/PqqE/SkfB family radical SAM enzyme